MLYLHMQVCSKEIIYYSLSFFLCKHTSTECWFTRYFIQLYMFFKYQYFTKIVVLILFKIIKGQQYQHYQRWVTLSLSPSLCILLIVPVLKTFSLLHKPLQLIQEKGIKKCACHPSLYSSLFFFMLLCYVFKCEAFCLSRNTIHFLQEEVGPMFQFRRH